MRNLQLEILEKKYTILKRKIIPKKKNPNNFEEKNNSNTIIYHCKMKFFKIIINIEDHSNTYL